MMTEEQKTQWVQALLQSGVQVGQLNMGDGTQNILVNACGQGYAPQGRQEENTRKEETLQEEEEEADGTESLARHNVIFNPRLFTTEARYELLRQAILRFICPKKEEGHIDAHTQAEWYYILKAIAEAGVADGGKLTDVNFLRQMAAWYPTLLVGKEGEDTEKMLRRYASSVSAERKKWIAGIDCHEVSIDDMFAHAGAGGYPQAKTLRLHGVAKELKKRLEALKKC